MRMTKKITSIVLALLMVVSLFVAVPMTASAVTEDDVESLMDSMRVVIYGYIDQNDFDHAAALSNYYVPLNQAFEEANLQVTPEVESAYNAAYAYFYGGSGGQGGSGGFNGNYPNVNNVYRATNDPVNVTVSDLQPGDVLVTSSAPLEVSKGNCNIVLVGGTYGEGDPLTGTLFHTYTDDVTLGNELRFAFEDNQARITDEDTHGRYDAVYNNALGNAYMVLGNDNGTVYLAGYNFTTYTITWNDYNGSNLYDGQSTVAAGAVPSYRWSVSRNSTAQYSYTFTGWTDSSNTFYSKDSDLPAASKDETYTATYSQTLRSYTITWKDGDNKTLKSDSVAYGTTPSYTGATPTKTEDDDYTYEFNNTWSPSVASVTGNATYTAQFTAVPKSTHTEHTYTANPTFNWTQDASTGDWDCDTLTLTCTGCDATQDYEVYGISFGGGGKSSAVKCTANADGSFTYSVSKKVDGVTYSDTKTLDANSVVKSATQLKAAAKKGGSWELGADLTGLNDVQCADGFVLDGKNHTVTRHANVTTQAVFRTTTNPAEVTLKNLTIDGIEGQSDSKPAIATKMSNPSAGNVINLENVTITNYDFDEANNGVVLAWGESTVNMTNCNIDTDSTYDVWGGAASTVNVNGGEVGTLYLNGGTASAELTNGAVVTSISALNGSTIKTDDPTIITAPEDYKVKDNGDGTYSIVAKEYVAQVGSTKYESLQDALDVTPDGGTVTVLKDITTSGNIFADGYVSGGNRTYTVDLGGYTVSGGTFIVADGNDVTFKNGTIESATYAIQNTATATVDSTATVKSTATDASAVFGAEGSTTNINGTVEGNKYGVIARGGTLNVAGKVTATNDDGRAITLNKGGAADINDGADIDGAYGVVVHKDANLNVNGGDIAGVYHAVSGNGTAADGPYTINVTGGTLTATNGAGIYNPNAAGTLNISGGTISGSTTAVAAGASSTNVISGGTFNTAVPEEYCADGFIPKDNGDGTYGVTNADLQDLAAAAFAEAKTAGLGFVDSTTLSGIPVPAKASILGVQLRQAPVDGEYDEGNGTNALRFITAVDKEFLQNQDITDYGYLITIGNTTRFQTCKNTTNNTLTSGADDDLEYFTAAIYNIPDENTTNIKVQFVFKTAGNDQAAFATYKNAGQYEMNTNYKDVYDHFNP